MIEQLKWRYATKQYDATKKISDSDLTKLIEAANLAPTSYGLQPFRIINVENPDLRAKLREKSYGQSQVTDASAIFVFVVENNMTNDMVDTYIDRIASQRSLPVEALSGFGDYMKGAIGYKSSDDIVSWNQRQAYISLGFLLAQAAVLNIDSTPMEGFDPAGYAEVLGLQNENAVLVCALGYRSSEDQTQHYPKVRKSLTEFVENK
jgi:nitroreductase